MTIYKSFLFLMIIVNLFRLEIIEQVNEAPRMYILAVAEVVRRRSFSSQFQKVKIHTELLYVHK